MAFTLDIASSYRPLVKDDAMDSSSSQQSENREWLRNFDYNSKFSEGNNLLHHLVLYNSHPNDSGSGRDMDRVLLSMSKSPANVVNALNYDGFSALHLAVLKNDLLMVEKLLSCLSNIDINIKNGDDQTALCYAASLGHLDIMRLLVERGADVNLGDGRDTPVGHAVQSGNLEAVQFLVCNGADVKFSDKGCNPLFYFVDSGNLDIIKFLVSKGADVKLSLNGSDHQAPLHYAAMLASAEFVEYLISTGADVNVRDKNGQTPLHYAKSENVDILVDHGAEINAKDKRHETPLHLAVKSRNTHLHYFLTDSSLWERRDEVSWRSLEIVKLLTTVSADLNAIGVDGRTPVHNQVDEHGFKIMEFLSDRGEDEYDTWANVHDADYRGFAEKIRLLLLRGADVDAVNVDGETPRGLARNELCIDALKKFG